MKAGQYSDQQIVAILKQAETGQMTIAQLCKEHNLSENTFYRWRSRFAPKGYPATPAEIAKNRELETENQRLKRLLAEPGTRLRVPENDILKELLGKK